LRHGPTCRSPAHELVDRGGEQRQTDCVLLRGGRGQGTCLLVLRRRCIVEQRPPGLTAPRVRHGFLARLPAVLRLWHRRTPGSDAQTVPPIPFASNLPSIAAPNRCKTRRTS